MWASYFATVSSTASSPSSRFWFHYHNEMTFQQWYCNHLAHHIRTAVHLIACVAYPTIELSSQALILLRCLSSHANSPITLNCHSNACKRKQIQKHITLWSKSNLMASQHKDRCSLLAMRSVAGKQASQSPKRQAMDTNVGSHFPRISGEGPCHILCDIQYIWSHIIRCPWHNLSRWLDKPHNCFPLDP